MDAMQGGVVPGLEGQMRSARRNVALLTVAQAILGSAAPMAFSAGGLVGYELLGEDKSLATAPLTGFNVGVALGAVAVAAASRFLGRKASFMLGALLAGMGGLVAAIALFRMSFWLFAAALLLIGLAGGFTQKIRFAAADASPSFYKGKAISWILAGGIVSAILGPQLAIWAKDYFAPITFAGTFMAMAPLSVLAVVVLTFLRLPEKPVGHVHSDEAPRPLRQIVMTRRFMTGLVCGIGSYALMTFMMVGAPLAMVIGCGMPTEMATLGIQWHVLAMFGPSFFTGILIARLGAEKVVAIGLVFLMICAIVAHMGVELWNFWSALILLGVGWNFGFIGSTAIVAESYRPNEADKVQGFNDIVLFGTVALSSFLSGQAFSAYGWNVMNLVIWPVTLVCMVLILAEMRAARLRGAALR